MAKKKERNPQNKPEIKRHSGIDKEPEKHRKSGDGRLNESRDGGPKSPRR